MTRWVCVLSAIGLVALSVALFAACDDHYDLDDQAAHEITPLRVEGSYLRDESNRYVWLNGANLSGSTKVPSSVDPVTYVGKPFDLADADLHFKILRGLGFDVVRLLIIWEGIEPEAPGVYDEAYLDYIAEVVRLAGGYGLYVYLDMHQDFFSRNLFALYNDETDAMSLYDPREIALAEAHGYNNRVGGDGAPAWAVQLCLPDKFVNGPQWGLPFWTASAPNVTSDVIPFSLWGLNIFISLDVNRCFAAMIAGRTVYPNYMIDGENIQDVLQNAYANAWAQVAERVKGLPNVAGYDLMNEPAGLFIRLALDALLYREAKSAGGAIDDAKAASVLDGLLATFVERGLGEDQAEMLREALIDYGGLPTSVEALADGGFAPESGPAPYRPDLAGALAINSNFNRDYLQPFYERVADAILAVDPGAIMFVEQSLGAMDQGIAGQWALPMTHLRNTDQMVFAPHWYTDIYPFIGFNVPPRSFTPEEKWLRDYHEDIIGAIGTATYSLGNPPVILGEYGTYFNFGGIEASIADDYLISTLTLNPYYEAFEDLLLHHTVWCYSPENTPDNGEGWNKEDFSILGPDQKPRSWEAYARPAPRATSGRLRSLRYYSPVHYFEPRPGEQTPYREFTMTMDAVETNAPTTISVPALPYPDGFYVDVSDGRCVWDHERSILSWYPADDDPAIAHSIRITPPYPNSGNGDWDYFFNGDEVLERGE